MSDVAGTELMDQPAAGATQKTITPRVWPAAVLVGAFWAFYALSGRLDPTIFVGFMSQLAASASLVLLFFVWWFAFSRESVKDRLLGFGLAVAFGVTAHLLADKSIGYFGILFFGLPVVLSAWTAWLIVARRRSPAVRRVGLLLVMSLVWGYFSLLRMDGVDGSSRAAMHWRWAPKAEELFLAERARAADSAATVAPVDAPVDSQQPLTVQEGDWPSFRGPHNDAAQTGIKIATDWAASPPKLLWKQRVGPGWSSVAIVDNRLFTQEQRGEMEAVVCLDAATGREVWVHEDAARFWESVAGAGPRATLTFADGWIYTFGGKGTLNCLDAATGKVRWSRDAVADSGAPLPMWGFSSSPLVVGGLVVVYAGAEKGAGLLAYRADSGEPAWTAPAGKLSYASAQVMALGGESQLVILSETGLTALDPATGTVLWEYAAPTANWRAIQPHPVGDAQILIGSEDLGLVLLDVARKDGAWAVEPHWSAKSMKPAYNDFVIHDGFVYGFDGGVFDCVELATGKRRWKGGRYGHGQVLLLADQPLLLVLSESGEAVLLAANPDKLEELSRFQAVQGKTWNHPVVAHGRLFARNDEEMACYELQPLGTTRR